MWRSRACIAAALAPEREGPIVTASLAESRRGQPFRNAPTPRVRIPSHLTHSLPAQFPTNAIPCDFESLTPELHCGASLINIQDRRRAARPPRTLPVGGFVEERRVPTLTSAQSNRRLRANWCHSLPFAISLKAPSCAIIRSSQCCANVPEIDISRATGRPSRPPCNPKKSAVLEPETNRQAEHPLEPRRAPQ